MDGSPPNLRRQLAGFLEGVITLDDLYRWSWDNSGAIEEYGSDEDVELLNLVLHRFVEHTGGHIDASQLLDALRTDPLVQQELQTHGAAVA